MRHVTESDVQRTRKVLAELANRQQQLGDDLAATGLTKFCDRVDWLSSRRSADEQLAWDRRWSRLPVERVATVTAIKKPRLTSDETISELEWLFSNGVTAWEAAAALGRSRVALSRWAYRQGRADLAIRLDGRESA